ncbi:MAG: FAD-dependent oxidoreductase [Rubrobacteraceae bacterium]
MQYPVKSNRLFDERKTEPIAQPQIARREGPKPVLLAVDDNPDALREIEIELRNRYGADYLIKTEASAESALESLRECKVQGDEVALVLTDQWMPGIRGIDLLARVREVYPTTKRVLMVDRADAAAAGPVVDAMTLGSIDYYANKPWGSYDERFHRIVTELLYEWAKDHLPKFEDIRIVGEQWSSRSHELRDLLGRNGVPYAFYPADSPEGQTLLSRFSPGSVELPLVVLFDGQVLEDPSNSEITEACRVDPSLEEKSSFDLLIIGAGPAGLAAAVYGASEGLDTLIVEGEALGGQAGTSSQIRNYLGFPWGVSGSELTSRAAEQAWLFGGTFLFMRRATAMRRVGHEIVVRFSCSNEVTARAVIVATGASYRRLEAPGLDSLYGAGVFYGAAVSEARAMEGQEVYVAGAGNSAGQTAMHLSKYASRVTVVVRGGSLRASMSEYLVREIEATTNIEVRLNTQVVDGGGEGRLERLVLKEKLSGHRETVPAAGLFVLIGAEPHTGWLPEEVQRDEQGFVFTGRDLPSYGRPRHGWHLGRLPLLLETSMAGVFAVGDVRHGSVKRVTSAVGEGSVAIQMIHEYLSQTQRTIRPPTPAIEPATL